MTELPRRITVYVTEKDREDIELLKALLRKSGVDIRGPRGEDSVSELFRYLRNKEIQRLASIMLADKPA